MNFGSPVKLQEFPFYIVTTAVENETSKKRRQAMFAHLEWLGIKDFQFIHSFYTPTEPSFGCSYGHAQAIEAGLAARPFKPFVVLEDDAAAFKEHTRILVPSDADAVYLGISTAGASLSGIAYKHVWDGNYYSQTEVQRIVRLYNMLSTHAVLINSEQYARNVQRCATEACARRCPIDVLIALTHRHYKVYAYRTPLFYQAEEVGGQEKYTSVAITGFEIRNSSEIPEPPSSCQPASVTLDMAKRMCN